MKPTKEDIKKDVETQLLFLKKTKEGKYAPIEKTSIPYARMEDRETLITFIEEEEFYYSIS
jgi:hypothetical protein